MSKKGHFPVASSPGAHQAARRRYSCISPPRERAKPSWIMKSLSQSTASRRDKLLRYGFPGSKA